MTSPLAIRTVRTATWVVAVTVAAAMTHTQAFGDPPSPGGSEPGEGPPSLEVTLESSYTAGGETKFRGAKVGDSDAFDANFGLSYFWDLDESWSIPFDLQSQNVFLDSLAGTPLPESIHTLEFGTGLAYRLDDSWMFMARISPVLYKLDDVGGNDIGLSGGLMAMWDYSPSLKFTFGVFAQPDNEFPVLPLVGMDWRIDEQWELRLMLLAPQLIYSPDDQWSFQVGMDSNFGTTFRTSNTLGTSIGLPQYDDALGSYSDLRFGGGVTYRLDDSWRLEASAGYSTSREIDYKDIGDKIKFDDAPYFRLGVSFGFSAP